MAVTYWKQTEVKYWKFVRLILIMSSVIMASVTYGKHIMGIVFMAKVL